MSPGLAPKVACVRNRTAAAALVWSSTHAGGGGGGVKVCEPLARTKWPLTSPAGKAALARNVFSHPSEELFANLLDFYRIGWEYEPRSFPLQWDKDGKVTEAFTPDFYLPEFDLYVELTTMKQALVTKKNHKIKLLKAIYPHINIQVFYQRDFQDLIFKYGLEGR